MRIAKWNGVQIENFEPFVEELHDPSAHKHEHGEAVLKSEVAEAEEESDADMLLAKDGVPIERTTSVAKL